MSDSRSVVFISNQNAKHDYSSAAQYGAMRPITQGNFPIFKIDRLTEEIIAAVLDASVEDYLLLSGSSVVASMCLTIWILIHRRAKLLLFDSRQDSYVPRSVSRADLILTIEQVKAQKEKGR